MSCIAVPDYTECCENCGNRPVVVLVEDNEDTETGLCGPCCFGEADKIDVETWNED